MTSVFDRTETKEEGERYRQIIISRNASLGLIAATETSRATVQGGNGGFISSSKIKRLALGDWLIVKGPVRCPVVPRPSAFKARSSTQIL
jgi:hypothetical protein